MPERKNLLLYPPLTDPTAPYHSLSYLKGHAASRGFTAIDIRDTNIEGFHHAFKLRNAHRLIQHIHTRRARLQSQHELTDDEQQELALLLCERVWSHERLSRAIRDLQSVDAFYDYSRYRSAVGQIRLWMRLLSCLGFPGQFDGFDLQSALGFDLSSTSDLTNPDVLEQINRPFQPYYRDVLIPEILRGRYALVGINITYTAQLPFALWIARQIRAALPEVDLICGGTEVSDLWKYKADPTVFDRIMVSFDAAVIGEGESAFTMLLAARLKDAWPEEGNVWLARGKRPTMRVAQARTLRVEKLNQLGDPDYSDLPWGLYLSPHRFVYYSPTRGCYWNRCTFCDYGLNGDAPTSPWRHDPVERVVKQVSEIARHSTFIYFSVDVLAPAMMLRFAEQIIEQRIQVFWGAEIRLEKYWSPEKCATLKRSGCVAVSVGFESGSDRVLGLIDKGTSVEQTRVTIRNLHGAGIGVQMMGFTGFPGETPGEAMESVEFLRSMRDCWTFGGLGSFDLTPGAIVAKEPRRFGVHDVRNIEGQDIHRTLVYSTDSDWDETEMQRIRTEKLKLQRAEFDRPWAGGTDTAHSYFYHQRYSTRVLAAMELKRTSTTHPGHMYELNGEVVHLQPGLTVDAYPETAVPRIRRLSPGEPARVPFVRADGAIFALPLPAADWLLTLGSAEAGSMGNAKYAKWLRGALDSDVLRIASAGERSRPALSQIS